VTAKNSKYKIAIFTSDTVPYYHGSGRNAFHFADALNAQGYNSYIITLNKLFRFPYKKQHGKTIIYRLPIWQRNKLLKSLTFPFCFLFYLYHIARAKQVLLYGRIIGFEFILLYSFLIRKPVYFQSTLLHADDLESINNRNIIVRTLGLTKMLSGYFAINPLFAQLSKPYLRQSAKVFLKPQGVDMDQFHPPTLEQKQKLRKRYGIANDALIFLTIGIVCKRKGYSAMFKELSKLENDFTLLVVGDYDPEPWSCFANFRKEMQQLKSEGEHVLGESVQFVGTTEHVEEYLQLADYFLFNSDAEGTPNALLEAMSCKTPIICKKLEGTEFFLNHATAHIYDNDSDLSPTIAKALACDNTEKTEHAYQFCRKHCSIEAVASAFVVECLS